MGQVEQGECLLGRSRRGRGRTRGDHGTARRGLTVSRAGHGTAAGTHATATAHAAMHTGAETFGQVRGDLTGFRQESGPFLLHLGPEGLHFCLFGGNRRLIRLFGLLQGPPTRPALDHHLLAHRGGVTMELLLEIKELAGLIGGEVHVPAPIIPPPMPPPGPAMEVAARPRVNDRANTATREILLVFMCMELLKFGFDFIIRESGL